MPLVLNVDDFEPQLYLRSATLRAAGFEVLEARTGRRALELTRDRRPDLVVLDVHLPDINGLDVCRQIKASVDTAQIPVLHVSATCIDRASRVAALDNGADGYLLQSVEPEEFLAQVRSLLRYAEAQARMESELRHSRAMLAEAERLSHTGAWEWDIAADRWTFSDEWLTIHGCSERTMSADQLLAITHPDDREGMMRAFEAVRRGEAPYDLEHRIIRRGDGAVRIVRSSGQYRDEPGSASPKVFGFVTDITEERRAEEVRARLAAIVESSDDAILAKDVTGRILSWNAGAERLLGYSSQEILGQPVDVLLPDDRSGEESAILERLRAGERVEHFETVRVAKDGRHIPVSISVAPLKDAAGRLIGVSKIMRDVTERRRVEERLQASEARYRALFEHMGEGFALGEAILDERGEPRDFRFLEANAAFEQQTGLGREVIGRPIRQVLPGLEDYWVQRYCHVAVSRKPLRFVDYNADTRRHYEVFCYSPAAGQFAILFRDVTDEKRANEERERLYRSAEEANRLKDDFLATLSHELRTPLTAILGWSRLLEQGRLNEVSVRQAHATIARNAEAQRQLLTDVLDVSRMISGKMRLEVKELDALDIVNLAVASIQPAVDAKRQQLVVSAEVSPALVTADADRLQQIIWNLLSNAVKFTPAGGRIDVRVASRRGTLDLVVSDTGIGFPPSFVPKLFARFVQADSSAARRYGGLGLGLSIVRHLVELHGGSVSGESPGEGLGATFRVSLPVRASRELHTSADVRAASQPDVAEARVDLSGLEVLVVDDLEDARTMVAVVLQSAGSGVTLAASAEEALQHLERRRPDVILADIGMPGMDGYAFARRLRSLPPDAGGSIPAVALTAFGSASDRDKALEAGFDAHLSKPVLPDELLLATARLSGRLA